MLIEYSYDVGDGADAGVGCQIATGTFAPCTLSSFIEKVKVDGATVAEDA